MVMSDVVEASIMAMIPEKDVEANPIPMIVVAISMIIIKSLLAGQIKVDITSPVGIIMITGITINIVDEASGILTVSIL